MARNPLTLLRSSIARHGLWRTLALVPRNIADAINGDKHRIDHEFDLLYGTDTSADQGLGGLTIDADHVGASNQYSAVWRKRFGEVMATAPVAHEKFVFVDIGSGKGKALLLASDFPFRRIVGIEFARELHEIATRNIALYRNPAQRCQHVASVCLDAMRYEFPPEAVFMFLNNPFGQPILGPVLDNLRQSLERAPRPAVVAYVNPVHGEFLEARMAGMFRRCASNEFLLVLATRHVE